MHDGTSLTVRAPEGWCPVNPMFGADADLIRQWTADAMPLVIGLADCRELAEARAHWRERLGRYVLVRNLTTENGARVGRTAQPLDVVLRTYEQQFVGWPLDLQARRDRLNDRLRQIDFDFRHYRSGTINLGLLGRDDIAVYMAMGMVFETQADGATRRVRTAGVLAFTVIGNWPVNVSAYHAHQGPQSFEASQELARTVILMSREAAAPPSPAPPGERPPGAP